MPEDNQGIAVLKVISGRLEGLYPPQLLVLPHQQPDVGDEIVDHLHVQIGELFGRRLLGQLVNFGEERPEQCREGIALLAVRYPLRCDLLTPLTLQLPFLFLATLLVTLRLPLAPFLFSLSPTSLLEFLGREPRHPGLLGGR